MPRLALVDMGSTPSDMVEGRHRLWGAVFGELRRLGYIEGRDFAIDRWGGGGTATTAGYKEIARKVVASKPRVIVARGASVLRPLAAETREIAIVCVASIPPTLYASYAHPGGNVTGVQTASDAMLIYSKQVEVLHSALSPSARIAWLGPRALWESPNGAAVQKAAALTHALVEPIFVQSPVGKPTLREAFAEIARSKFQAVLVSAGVELFPYRETIAELAASQRLPSLGNGRLWADAGTLFGYGADLEHNYRRAANQIHAILKGASPAAIPIEQPDKVDFVVNLQTAKSIGVTIPQTMLIRADKVIQ